jgi:hypothetical protein
VTPQRRQNTSSTTTRKEETGFYEAYGGFARALRVWFITYGIGGPALLLSNNTAGQKLFASGEAGLIAYLFFGAVGLQLVLALMYKSAMWYLYIGEFNTEAKGWRLHRASEWLSESYWVEFGGDLVTLVLFAGATLRILRILF